MPKLTPGVILPDAVPDLPKATIACGATRLSRAVLLDNVARLAGGLAELGVEPGDRIGLICRNSLAFLEITLGAGKLGAFAVPINWHFTASEVAALLEDCAPRVIFVDSGLRASLPLGFADNATVITVGSCDGPLAYERWRDASAPLSGEDRPSPGSIVYTSGTTGRPKGVRRDLPTPEQQRRMRAVRSRLYNIQADSRVLVPGPLYHAFPNQFAVHGAMHAAHTEIMERFDPEAFLQIVQRERITSVALAPIMFVRLLRLPSATRAAYDVSPLRWAIHSGGPCAEDVKRQMIAWWGEVITEYYGGTELGPLTLCTSQDWLARPGTCGRPLAEAQLRLVDSAGADVAPGTPGELYGRLWCYPDFTYHNDPGKRAEVGLGPLATLGDVAYQDADGYLYLCDRVRDMIVSGGVNIYPAEIEGAMFTLPGITDCAVFGIPDPEFGEAVVALACGEGLDAERIRSRLRELIAGYKVPRSITIVPSLGRDASGKIRKRELRSNFLAGA